MDRFETITNIGQRAADDHRHGVVEVRAAQLLLDSDWEALAFVGLVLAHLNIQVAGFEGIVLDEAAPRFHRVAHQDGEEFVGLGRILDCHNE